MQKKSRPKTERDSVTLKHGCITMKRVVSPWTCFRVYVEMPKQVRH